jgi:hypothetical protein
MVKRIQRQIRDFFKKWKYWVLQFLLWIILLIRDKYATDILSWIGEKYGDRMEKIIEMLIRLLPKDVSGWALLILAVSIIGILLYDLWDVRRSEASSAIQKDKRLNVLADIVGIRQPDKKHLGLEVVNKESLDLEHCYGTLVSIVYLGNKSSSKETDITHNVNPNDLTLSSGGESKNGKKTIAKHQGKGILNIAMLSDFSEGIIFMFHSKNSKAIKREGGYSVKVRLDSRLNRKSVRVEFERVFIFRRNVFDADENNPGASLVTYPLEASRTMSLHEDGTMDLIITEFGWL